MNKSRTMYWTPVASGNKLALLGRPVMKLKVIVATLLTSLIAISTAHARGPYSSINVGNWKGGAYTNDQTGEFTHCAAGAGYDSGIYFMVTVDQGAGWALGFHNPKWTLANNQTFQIALTFDGQRPFNVQGVAISGNLIRVPMPVDSTLIAQFRKAKAMTAFTQGQLFQFKLDQTAVLLPALANCVAVVRQQGIANALHQACTEASRRGGSVAAACGRKPEARVASESLVGNANRSRRTGVEFHSQDHAA
jgi:hypothetical protein